MVLQTIVLPLYDLVNYLAVNGLEPLLHFMKMEFESIVSTIPPNRLHNSLLFIKLIDFYFIIFLYIHNMYLLRGALTSKPYSFVARPWEFKSIESIDFFDSIGAAIRFDIRGDKIIRVLPRLHEDINEEWISDRTRFSVDGFRLQRIDGPLLNINQAFKNLSWVNAVYFLSNLLFKTKDLNFDFLMNFGQIKNQNLNVNYFNDSFSDFENEIWLNLFTSCFFF